MTDPEELDERVATYLRAYTSLIAELVAERDAARAERDRWKRVFDEASHQFGAEVKRVEANLKDSQDEATDLALALREARWERDWEGHRLDCAKAERDEAREQRDANMSAGLGVLRENQDLRAALDKFIKWEDRGEWSWDALVANARALLATPPPERPSE